MVNHMPLLFCRYLVAGVDGLPASVVARVKQVMPDRVMDWLTLNT
jgi:hypothetical protein